MTTTTPGNPTQTTQQKALEQIIDKLAPKVTGAFIDVLKVSLGGGNGMAKAQQLGNDIVSRIASNITNVQLNLRASAQNVDVQITTPDNYGLELYLDRVQGPAGNTGAPGGFTYKPRELYAIMEGQKIRLYP